LFGFFTDCLQDFWLWGGKFDVIANAQEHGSGSTALLDDERPAFQIDTAQ
jgi:hypothetical protein